MRTHFSDDLLWLPYACLHYLEKTGDSSLLSGRVERRLHVVADLGVAAQLIQD